MTIFCGIDPGLTRCGYGILKANRNRVEKVLACGMIKTNPQNLKADRLAELYLELSKLFLEFSPDFVCVEKVFFQRNINTVTAVTQANGIAIMLASQNGIPSKEYTPTEIKSSVAGWGAAGKIEVQKMVEKLCKIDTSKMKSDVTDALACAITGIFKENLVNHV